MNFDIPELGQVGIEELLCYGIIDTISASGIVKISFLQDKLQRSIRMFEGKRGFVLDIDSKPCEWITRQPYKMSSYLPAYHYIMIIPYHVPVQVVGGKNHPVDLQDMS
ncbi:hypothetical protein Ddye_030078 [Dipteronia dyeriana]|uniref:Uncharacterized protein n=1 Tax=Dipteronia dyeriana TaxID=168575 RepID=A0AAD9TGD8_9ROSI|nr:hypothetical protein Ddye_030078 [Dipteronia dyeriana]